MEEKEFVHNPRYKTRGIYHHFEGESYLQLYVRPYDEFFEELDPVKYPNAKQKYRFELLDVGDFDYNVFKKQPSHKYQYVGLLFND